MLGFQAKGAAKGIGPALFSNDFPVQEIPPIELYPWFAGIDLHYPATLRFQYPCGKNEAFFIFRGVV